MTSRHRKKIMKSYDTHKYDLHDAVVKMLNRADSNMVGTWEKQQQRSPPDKEELLLQEFRVAVPSLNRSAFGGQCENAQRYLSDHIASDTEFLSAFDTFVRGVVLPWLKDKLIECQMVGNSTDECKFYYQRPPTLRLQPGPSRAYVKAHADSDYGHQDGELNFWIPLVNLEQAGKTYLHVESEPNKGDYHPIVSTYGDVVSFHGSFCRHFVPANASNNTRISLDFRIGLDKYFDTKWQMIGTTADHARCEVTY
uniref:Fe2OG dioxygenase domain-containing protein n=1 Tax=Eucampia antarctica TaxID=49252 RepID=A0A7S2RI15_9STRA|mmetsp:Transcript_22530/g.21651  ORF Transcript_22530/g.21651 Transcript_22530/m.21651 type:complete len:253 (+) Transcript_22530:88-846(+)